ncbi:MAG: tetratricopeptide repeat protein [Saprospiraceae bacterium]
MKYYYCILLMFLVTQLVSAQVPDQRISEDQIQTQKIFIEANREKILGNYDNAAKLYEEVLKRASDNDAAAYELARVYDVLDKDELALKSIKKAVELDEKNKWYRMFWGDVLDKLGKYEAAAEIYEKLAKDDPQNIEYHYTKLGFYLVKSQKPEKAIKVYNTLEKEIGVVEELSRKKYNLYLGLGKTKKAIAELQNLIEAYPSMLSFRHQLATFYLSNGKQKEAKAVYQNILALDPNDAKANIALMQKGSSQEEGMEAIFSNPELDIDSKIKELLPSIQKIAKTGDQDLAVSAGNLAKILTEVHPQEAKGFSAYADILYHSGKATEALNYYNQAISLDNSVFSIWEQIMYIQLEQKQMTALVDKSKAAMELFPNRAKSYYFNGIANYEINQPKAAIKAFRQALLMSRKSPKMQLDLNYRLGAAHYQLKAFKKAKKSLEKCIALGGDKIPAVLEQYGDTLFQLNEVDKALVQWQNALEKGATSKNLEKKIADKKLYE